MTQEEGLKRGPGRPKKESVIEQPEVDINQLKDGQKVQINVIQEKPKFVEPKPCLEVVALRADIKAGRVKKVVFNNLLDPKEDIPFSYGSGSGAQTYHLEPGLAYELPQCVIDWLHTRRIVGYSEQPRPDGRGTEVVPDKKKTRNKFLLSPYIAEPAEEVSLTGA